MKKFITAAALLAASGALASAATTTVDLVTLITSTDTTTYASSSNTTQNNTLGGYDGSDSTAATTSDVTSLLGSASAGTVYFGTGTLKYNASWTDFSSVSVSNIALQGRTGYRGEWAALVVSVSSILATNSTATIDDLTTLSISYDSTSDSYPVLTAWVISDGTASALTVSNGTIDVSSVTASDNIVILFSSSGTTATVTNLSVTTTIPEPSAYGLLAGVGALALVAARRRRSR